MGRGRGRGQSAGRGRARGRSYASVAADRAPSSRYNLRARYKDTSTPTSQNDCGMAPQHARKCYPDDDDGRRAAAIAARKKSADRTEAKSRRQDEAWEEQEAVRWGLT